MNESLSAMIKRGPIVDREEPEEILPDYTNTTQDNQANQNQEDKKIIKLTSLISWFDINYQKFPKVNKIQVLKVQGIDSAKTILVTIPDPKQEKLSDGTERRRIKVFDDADQIPVVNLPGDIFEIYSNGFRIEYVVDNDLILRTYGVKTGLYVSVCHNYNSLPIPYMFEKIEKKNLIQFEVPVKDKQIITKKLNKKADLEAIQILYKQITPSIGQLSTNKTVLDWFLTKQLEVADVNHHLMIDNVLKFLFYPSDLKTK
jgi:hypothetical protein